MRSLAIGAALVALGVIGGVAVLHGPRPIDLPKGWSRMEWRGIGHLDASAAAHVRRGTDGDGPEASHWAFLAEGAVRAEIEHQEAGHPFVVVTPHVRVVVVGTLFSVETTPDLTRVAVERGRVRVEAGSQFVVIGPGERVSSDDPRLRAGAPDTPPVGRWAPTASLASSSPGDAAAAPPTRRPVGRPSSPIAASTGTCGLELRGPAGRRCLEGLIDGQGLPAQNALFQLGLLDRAEDQREASAADWSALLQRFPSSPLASDASSNLVSDLMGLGRYGEALDAAEAFPRRFPSDPRCAAVALIRANLLREHLGRVAEAARVYAEVGRTSGPPEVHDEALYLRGLSQVSLGQARAAQETWRSYLAQFPTGRHRAEVEAQVSR